MNYTNYLPSPSPILEQSEDIEMTDISLTITIVCVRIIIEPSITIQESFKVSKSTQGISLTSLYQTLYHFQFCTATSAVTFYGLDQQSIQWTDDMPEIYMKPFAWLDGTEFLEVRIANMPMQIEYDGIEETAEDSQSQYTMEELKCTRSRERKISEVSEKLDKWKQECVHLKGIMPDAKKISEKAADIVGIPKKSLDDYMHQIKLGIKYNFDFSKNLDDKIGKLRQFNKREESRHKRSHRKSM